MLCSVVLTFVRDDGSFLFIRAGLSACTSLLMDQGASVCVCVCVRVRVRVRVCVYVFGRNRYVALKRVGLISSMLCAKVVQTQGHYTSSSRDPFAFCFFV